MTIEYNENMELVFYMTGEIELVEHYEEPSKRRYHLYFKNVFELSELLKTNPELLKELKEMI